MTGRSGWILLVDDDEDIRDALALILTTHGYRVVGAFDGVDALEQLRNSADGAPALVFLDLMMPRLNGVELAKELRSRAETRDVPIVVLSGDNRACETAASLKTAGRLPKPVELQDLLATVRRLVPETARDRHP